MSQRASPSKVRRPDLFIVGAPKCGTTAMTQYLASHPDLYMARKEMHFFGSDLKFGTQFYRRDLAAYLEEFRAWNGQPRAGEASVWYLFSTSAAAEIKAFSPDARILIMLRDPVEMIHSLYCYFRFDGNEFLPTFAEALEAETDRRAGRRLGRRTYFPQGLAYRQTARYAEQVQRYLEAFGRERVRVVVYDDFAADTEAVCRQTLEFLELDPSRMETEFQIINSARRVRNPALQSVLGEPLVRSAVLAIRPWLPQAVFRALRSVEGRLLRFNARVEPRPPLEPRLRDQLRHELASETEALGRLLGRDLSAWNGADGPHARSSTLPVWLPEAASTH